MLVEAVLHMSVEAVLHDCVSGGKVTVHVSVKAAMLHVWVDAMLHLSVKAMLHVSVSESNVTCVNIDLHVS